MAQQYSYEYLHQRVTTGFNYNEGKAAILTPTPNPLAGKSMNELFDMAYDVIRKAFDENKLNLSNYTLLWTMIQDAHRAK